jgi:hypothetical protein
LELGRSPVGDQKKGYFIRCALTVLFFLDNR